MLDTPLTDPLGVMTVMAMRGVGVATAEKALARFGSLRELHDSSPESCKGVLTAPQAAAFRDMHRLEEAHAAALAERDRAEECGAMLLTPWDEGYPERLRGIPERPLVLYAMGDLSGAERAVACVGTREPNKFGETVCRRMTAMLADGGYAIVSGLARGIDHDAHEVALERRVPTLAVLGCGLDGLSTERQRGLAQRILDAGGALLTEQPFGREAEPGTLIRRNRIQSGISLATFVMQSKPDGGTMQTVRYSLMQGRPVYAPMPSGLHARDEANAGLMLLLTGTGPDLAAAIGAKGSFVDFVAEHWSDRPPATAISGTADYVRVLAELEALALPREDASPRP